MVTLNILVEASLNEPKCLRSHDNFLFGDGHFINNHASPPVLEVTVL